MVVALVFQTKCRRFDPDRPLQITRPYVIYYQAINYSLRRYSDPCEAMYIMQGLRDQSLFEHHLSETAKIGPPKP